MNRGTLYTSMAPVMAAEEKTTKKKLLSSS